MPGPKLLISLLLAALVTGVIALPQLLANDPDREIQSMEIVVPLDDGSHSDREGDDRRRRGKRDPGDHSGSAEGSTLGAHSVAPGTSAGDGGEGDEGGSGGGGDPDSQPVPLPEPAAERPPAPVPEEDDDGDDLNNIDDDTGVEDGDN